MFWLAPTIMLANVAYSATAESLLTFFPLFGISLGLTENFALGLMTLMGFGTMILVMPLGWLADHIDRMGMLAACVALSMVGLMVMPWVLQAHWLAVPFAFMFGGVEGMIYTLGVILVGERFKGALLAAATTMVTACWGAGTVIGPLLVGAGMDRFGTDQMAFLILLIFAAYLPFPLVSWVRSRTSQADEEVQT